MTAFASPATPAGKALRDILVGEEAPRDGGGQFSKALTLNPEQRQQMLGAVTAQEELLQSQAAQLEFQEAYIAQLKREQQRPLFEQARPLNKRKTIFCVCESHFFCGLATLNFLLNATMC
jgi:Spy/CpxP family protein refolding chaperone